MLKLLLHVGTKICFHYQSHRLYNNVITPLVFSSGVDYNRTVTLNIICMHACTLYTAHADCPQYNYSCTHAQIACSLLKLEQYNYMMHEVSAGIFAISGPTPDQCMQPPKLTCSTLLDYNQSFYSILSFDKSTNIELNMFLDL